LQTNERTIALVTGGASGLGGATTRRLVADGLKVLVVDLPSSGGAGLVAELGDAARFVAADVRDESQVQAAIDAAREQGELRVVVNCAGIGTPGRVVGRSGPHPLEAFQDVIDINLVGTFNVLRLAAAAMLANEPVDGQIGQAAYAASKGGIVGLTLAAARDLADKGVRVMTIAPGTFETPMLAGLPPEATAALAAQVPHPSRLGNPSEYAALVHHIIENGMLNGEVIRLDGALRMPPR